MIVVYFGIAAFAIFMTIFTTVQNRKNANSAAKSLGAGLQKKPEDTLKNITVKCPTCGGVLEKKNNVYICSNCGETFNANEI